MEEEKIKLRSVNAAYFSPTGNARKIVTAVAETVSGKTGAPFRAIDFTLPHKRRAVHRFEAGDLLVIGTPVYAGRGIRAVMEYFDISRDETMAFGDEDNDLDMLDFVNTGIARLLCLER